MNSDEHQRQQDAANSYRRKMAWRRTPTENMRLFCQLQQQAFEAMKSNPDAMRHFVERNHRKRRQSEVDRLLMQCRGTDGRNTEVKAADRTEQEPDSKS